MPAVDTLRQIIGHHAVVADAIFPVFVPLHSDDQRTVFVYCGHHMVCVVLHLHETREIVRATDDRVWDFGDEVFHRRRSERQVVFKDMPDVAQHAERAVVGKSVFMNLIGFVRVFGERI